MLFRKENKIDELSREKRELVLKRDKLKRDMHNRNSKRETKIAILENAGQTDFENTNKKIVELDRQIEKGWYYNFIDHYYIINNLLLNE